MVAASGGGGGGGGSGTAKSTPVVSGGGGAPAARNSSVQVTGLSYVSQWNLPNPSLACMDACVEMIGARPSRKNAIDTNVIGENGQLQNQIGNSELGVRTIDDYLERNKPIIVGVNRDGGTGPNANDATQHFVVVQGRSADDMGVYYTFWDPGTQHEEFGTSNLNRLYLNSSNYNLSGTTEYSGATYTVTEVRPY